MHWYTQVFTAYKHATLFERVFILFRLLSCPFKELLERIPAKGSVLDIGCGFGLLPLLLLSKDSKRVVMGIDPDRRRIAVGKKVLAHYAKATLKTCLVSELPKRPTYDVVTIVDILYLLPTAEKTTLLAAAKMLLTRRGQLLVKINDRSRSWQYALMWLQESVTVHLLKKTVSHSNSLYFESTEELVRLLKKLGFQVTKVEQLKTPFPFYHPHWLIVANA